MALFSLLTALLLPWIAGALLVAALPLGAPPAGRRLRAAGFGYLVGMAMVAWTLRAGDLVTGGFTPGWTVALLIAVLGLSAWRLRADRRTPETGNTTGPASKSGWRRASWLVLALAALHVGLSAVEILVQPVFPWDGWTVWVYRAKAWFFSDALAPIVSKQAWLAAQDAAVYSTPALAYPILPSMMPLWAALGLGDWHESLVNLPTLACGIAVALGVAGCVRGSGGGHASAILAAYLLLSTPLFGVHMSLGGYADLWMAAFAGLGMTAVLWGLLERRRQGLALGLVLLILGVGVKVEGWVWLGLALLVIPLVVLRGRTLAAIAIGSAVLLALAWATGWTVIDTPGPGQIGYRDGHLYVPLKGIIRMERFEVGPAYLANAFLMGNWHLLWVMLAAALALLALQPRKRLLRVAGAFILPFLLIQAVVFGLTTEGAWAQDYTAINRMPLQMLPALVFLLVVTGQRAIAGAGEIARHRSTLRRLAVGGLAGLVLTAGAALAWLGPDSDPAVPPQPLDGGRLNFVAGGGERSDRAITIERYQNGIALLSSGQVRIDPAALTQLAVTFEAEIDPAAPESAPAFFWRRADQARDVSRITLLRSGRFNLLEQADWRGTIVEVGFLFVDDGKPGAAVLQGARLEGPSLANRLRLLPDQWTRFETWSQQSAHFLWGGAPRQLLPLTLLAATFALLAGISGALLLGRRGAALAMTVMLLLGWAVLDVRWLGDRARQAAHSLAWWQESPIGERLGSGEPGRFHAYLERLSRERLGPEASRVIIVGDPGLARYYALKAKYQLLPHSSIVSRAPPPARQLETVDYVLFLGPFSGAERAGRGGAPQARLWQRLGLADRPDLQQVLELVEQDPQGALFRVRP